MSVEDSATADRCFVKTIRRAGRVCFRQSRASVGTGDHSVVTAMHREKDGSMNKDERQAMMKSMMEQFFAGMGADEKKEMCATMMGKMTEGLDMKEMMPKMMMGMMSGGAGAGPGKMQEMMAEKMQGGSEQQMPEIMLKTMMPHCIGMMLPAIDPAKRGEVAAAILSAIVEKGAAGMSDEQTSAFLGALNKVLNA